MKIYFFDEVTNSVIVGEYHKTLDNGHMIVKTADNHFYFSNARTRYPFRDSERQARKDGANHVKSLIKEKRAELTELYKLLFTIRYKRCTTVKKKGN